jgi:hypothetical protein
VKPVNTELFCPNCGVKDVWQDESDPGDYYEGTSMHCLACDSVLSDIRVSFAPTEGYAKDERDAFVRCVRTGEQPPPRPPLPPGPYDPILARMAEQLAQDAFHEHPALDSLKKAEPFSGLAFYVPVSYAKEGK